MTDYKQCCTECGFHFFDEDECPNCDAQRIADECDAEWDRQLRLLEIFTGISCNDHFWFYWNSENLQMHNWFESIAQKVAPDIYEWYMSIDMELNGQEWPEYEPGQLNLFEPELPF